MPRLATINLDWLDFEIKHARGNKPFVDALIEVRFKCTPIEDEKVKFESEYHPESLLPKYCRVKNKEYCFLHNQYQECTDNKDF